MLLDNIIHKDIVITEFLIYYSKLILGFSIYFLAIY